MTLPQIHAKLHSLSEESYRRFSASLMPTIDPKTVLGVRIPLLRVFAKELAQEGTQAFLEALPHKYYEENNLHAFLIAEIRDFDTCIAALNRFLPYVDNWATCDSLRPKCFAKHRAELLPHIRVWLSDPHPYTVRFGIEMLMVHFLDAEFDPAQLSAVAAIQSDEYYVNMMISWYFATALAKQYESALPYLTERRLSDWVHQKTLQKAVESNRISGDVKTFLKTLRI